jgi:hypothetical protein
MKNFLYQFVIVIQEFVEDDQHYLSMLYLIKIINRNSTYILSSNGYSQSRTDQRFYYLRSLQKDTITSGSNIICGSGLDPIGSGFGSEKFF